MATAYRKQFVNVKQTTSFIYFFWGLGLALVLLSGAVTVEAGDRFDKGLLWKIEAAGVEPNYLFGTMHSDDPRVVELPTPVRTAFEQARGVTLEVVLDPQSLLTMTMSLMMSDGTTLESLIGSSLYKRTVQVMSAQGIPEMMVANMKPWAVAVTLMTPPTHTGLVLDHVLYQQAVADGKAVDGLETVAEQMGLFDSLSLEDQVKLLEETLDSLPAIQGMLVELQEAYLQRDLKRLVEINDASMQDSDPELAATFNQKVIVDRNRRMADRMESRLRDGRRFIAVGALHLPGDDGLLHLLSQRGFRVTRVY
jgi:uncharacterized protein YbaP (TraB family)